MSDMGRQSLGDSESCPEFIMRQWRKEGSQQLRKTQEGRNVGRKLYEDRPSCLPRELSCLVSTVVAFSPAYQQSLTLAEAGAALKPDSQKTYLEQAKDTIAGKADVSVHPILSLPRLGNQRHLPMPLTRTDDTSLLPPLASPSPRSPGPSRPATPSLATRTTTRSRSWTRPRTPLAPTTISAPLKRLVA